MNTLLFIYLIGVILMTLVWICDTYNKYKQYRPITIGYVCAIVCISLLSWFTILIPIALALRDNINITLLKRKEK